MKKLLKVAGYSILVFFFLLGILFVFKGSVLRAVGNFLIIEDPVEQVEAIFVLGGSSFDRGNEAARLFRQGFSHKIVCLGENVPSIFKAIGVDYAESEVTQINLIKNNKLPRENVEVLKRGTSTKEEAEAIVQYCLDNEVKRAIVISDKFHTRRVKHVFEPLLSETGIQLLVHGSPSSQYDENNWWKEESGLIMVNNEYVKLVYYFIKY